jgi:hypothetical protein
MDDRIRRGNMARILGRAASQRQTKVALASLRA